MVFIPYIASIMLFLEQNSYIHWQTVVITSRSSPSCISSASTSGAAALLALAGIPAISKKRREIKFSNVGSQIKRPRTQQVCGTDGSRPWDPERTAASHKHVS